MGSHGSATLTEGSKAVEPVDLVGELPRSLDDRGRLSVPTAFRPAFASGVIVMKWQGPCVAVMPVEEYRSIEESMRHKQRAELADARARQALNSLAGATRLDAAGRVFIPEDLRAFAGFERELLVVGQRVRLELWSRPLFEEGAEERWQALVAHIAAEAL